MESITKVLKHYRFNVFNFSVVVSPKGVVNFFPGLHSFWPARVCEWGGRVFPVHPKYWAKKSSFSGSPRSPATELAQHRFVKHCVYARPCYRRARL
jgi:hypothetical protein